MDHEYTIDQLKSMVPIEDLIKSYKVPLKQQGVEFTSCCPFHEEKTPSFTVNASKQFYYCFGCGAGGDHLDFIQEYEGCDTAEAIRILKRHAGVTDSEDNPSKEPPKPPPKRVIDHHDPSDDWEAIIPVPESAPKLMISQTRTCKLFNPKTEKEFSYQVEIGGVYPYRVNGDTYGAVLRVIINDKKQTPTITYCVNKKTGEERWITKKFPEPRPLYNTNEFKGHDQVLVVEGEKCADFAHNDSGGVYDVCSWPMGTSNHDKTDWTPLYGRNVVLWADNDLKLYARGKNEGQLKPEDEQAGRKAMIWIKKHLEENGCTVTLLDQPADKPDGWDCADLVEEGGDLIQYIADHTPVVDVPAAQQQDDTLDQAKTEIVPLGYDDGRFYYYSKFTNQIKMLRDRDHTKNAQMGIAPIEWWLSKFQTSTGKVDWDEATSYMMQSCRNVGIFDKKKIRGRGCWVDDNRFVLHLGDRLIVDGATVDLAAFRSNYVYQAAPRKKAPSNALTATEAKGILEAAKAFQWDMPASAALLAGFCVLAPICSSLEWRPHAWITGGSGSGKSTVFDMFVRPVIGDMGIYSSLESTSAGLTQKLKSDGFPVVFEEFDPSKNKRSDIEKAQGFFNLMRLASDDSDIEILRGSANGESVTYNVNSMFCLIGIQICTDEQAVLNRTAQLSLKSRPMKTSEQKTSNKKQWDLVKKTLDEKVFSIENLSSRVLARTLGMIDIIQHNIKVFRSAATKHFGSSRYGDQYGTLLAGAYALVNDGKIKEEVALRYIESYDWTVYTEDSEDDESVMALNSILQVRLRVDNDGAPRTFTVIEAIESVRTGGLLSADCDKELRRLGIICDRDEFIVANKSDSIEKELAGRPWGTNWGKYLKRIIGPDGQKTRSTPGPRSFGGIQQRGTVIGYEIIFKNDQESLI